MVCERIYFTGVDVMKNGKPIQKWIPLFITLALSAVTMVIYSVIAEEKEARMYLQITAAAFVPAILPLTEKATRRGFPIFLNVLISLHIILANNMGSALGFYELVPSWDLIMHGYFGFVFAFLIYILLLKWNGIVLNKFGICMVVFLSTLGAAALWEIWEFSCDTFLGGDAQRVLEALENGKSPVSDTMTDIIISIAGIAVFYIVLFIDKLRGCKISGKIRINERKDTNGNYAKINRHGT